MPEGLEVVRGWDLASSEKQRFGSTRMTGAVRPHTTETNLGRLT